MRELWKNNLVQITRLTALERDGARLEGERGQLVASVAQAKGKVTETELQVIQIDQDLSSEVAKDMREVDAKFGEFVERKVAAEDQLKRIDLRAPQDGTVLESKVHTVGGVVPAGETIMLIVPDTDNLLVEAKVSPHDIDQMQIGQIGRTAVFRFQSAHHAGNQRHDHPRFRRHHDGPAHGTKLLHHPHCHDEKRNRPARRCKTYSRHAGRGLRPDRRAFGFVLPDQALAGSIHADVPGKMTSSPLRPRMGDHR